MISLIRNRFVKRSRVQSLFIADGARNTLLKSLLAISSESNENYVGVFDRNLFRHRYKRLSRSASVRESTTDFLIAL